MYGSPVRGCDCEVSRSTHTRPHMPRFHVSNTTRTYAEAARYCAMNGLALASLHSAEENGTINISIWG